MKRRNALGPSSRAFREGVEWIACNDNPGDAERAEDVAGYISVLLLADLSGIHPDVIARRVVRARKEMYGR